MDESGSWCLSPAYDLTFSHGPAGEHSMTVSGEGKSPSKQNIMRLAEKFNIDECLEIYDEVKEAVLQWERFAKQATVSKNSRNRIWQAIKALT